MDPTVKANTPASFTYYTLYRSHYTGESSRDAYKLETIKWAHVVELIQAWRAYVEDDNYEAMEDYSFGKLVLSENDGQLSSKTVTALVKYFGQMSLSPHERDDSISAGMFDSFTHLESYVEVYGDRDDAKLVLYQTLCGILTDAAHYSRKNRSWSNRDIFSYTETTHVFTNPAPTSGAVAAPVAKAVANADFI